MKVLGLDISSKTGWSSFEDERLVEYGKLLVTIEDFNVNDNPDKSPKYPWNLMAAAFNMGMQIHDLALKLKPDHIVIENTVKGRNRHTQRLLEWIHYRVLYELHDCFPISYLDPSAWRSILQIRLDKEQKSNNRLVSKGIKRGRITKKHLAVNWVNKTYSLKLKLKDNDVADSIALTSAFIIKQKSN